MTEIDVGLRRRRDKGDTLSDACLNEKEENVTVFDAGNKPQDHYSARLSPFRYKTRAAFLPLIRRETEILFKLQTKMRRPFLDFYFAWSANLASHTFYVLMLPLPLWFGATLIARDLIYILGLGIYITGNLKDCLCLPRPRSPPLHRITMSSYTTQEYGFPSSHSANATGVTFLLLFKVYQHHAELSPSLYKGLMFIFFIYYISLIFGRVYCGMHGFLDIIAGSLIGFVLFIYRVSFGVVVDKWLLESHNDSTLGLILTPIVIVSFFVLLIHVHVEPVDDCPCFDDSVAFLGVLIGLELSHWLAYVTGFFANRNRIHDFIMIEYHFEELGYLKSILRVIVGILIVVLWKVISKQVVFTILPPLYKLIGIYIPRRFYKSTAFSKAPSRQIRSQSLSNINEESRIGDLNSFIKGVTDHEKRENVGPESEIDMYEILDYANETGQKVKLNENMPLPGVFKPRYDVEIVGRLIVYAGIPFMATYGFVVVAQFINILN